MKTSNITCDGCGKDINKDKYFHEIRIEFKTWIHDPNTNQSESDASMARNTNSFYCDDCYSRLIEHIQKFVDESVEIENNAKKKEGN